MHISADESFPSRASDRPFRPALMLTNPGVAEAALDLSAPMSNAVCQARASLIANLASLDHNGSDWLFYSRDNNHYAGLGAHVPAFYRRQPVVAAVGDLERAGLIEHQQTRPSPGAGYRSRIRPLPRLLAVTAELSAEDTSLWSGETIILRDQYGKPIVYRDATKIRVIRQDLGEVNAALADMHITVVHPDVRYDAQGFMLVHGQRINPTRKSLIRVFNGTFQRGGRFYGGFWQGLPADVRSGLRINGEPTVEQDFACCHPRLLAAIAGMGDWIGDFYAGFEVERSEAKRAVAILLNAANHGQALRALASELMSIHGERAAAHARSILKTVRVRHPALARYWGTGYGLRLQHLDATICMHVQRRLRHAGIPCLAIHDSFVVPASSGATLAQIMRQEFEAMCARLRNA